MTTLLDKLHARVGDLWWYSLMIFVACRSGDVIQAFIGLWLVPKYVGPQELGAVLPLQQLSNLFAVPLAIIATVFAKYVNTYATRGEYGKVKCFIRDILLASVIVFLVCIITAYIVIPHFYIRLNVASGMLTILILAAGFSSNIANLFSSALQGLKKFNTMTVQNIISAPIRLMTLLIAMPFRALSGYILGQTTPPASCSILAAFSIHQKLKSYPFDASWRKDIPEILHYFWPVAIYMAFGALTSAIGGTIYRQRLPEIESAANYLLLRFAEIAGYIGMSMTVVLVPMASEAHETGHESPKLVRDTVIATLILSSVLSILYFYTAPHILSLSPTWETYKAYQGVLPPLTFISGLGTAIGAIVSYEMACRRFTPAVFIVISNVLCTFLLISLTGYEAYRGLLPDTIVDWMASLHVARLSILTWYSLTIAVVQLTGLKLLSKI